MRSLNRNLAPALTLTWFRNSLLYILFPGTRLDARVARRPANPEEAAGNLPNCLQGKEISITAGIGQSVTPVTPVRGRGCI
jgi:hypothetical protein